MEKSRRTIQLDKRGYEPGGHPILAGFFGIIGLIFLIYCAGVAISGYGTYFFLIWGVMGACSLLLALMLRSGRIMNAIPPWIKGVFWAFFFIGLLLFGAGQNPLAVQRSGRPGGGLCHHPRRPVEEHGPQRGAAPEAG